MKWDWEPRVTSKGKRVRDKDHEGIRSLGSVRPRERTSSNPAGQGTRVIPQEYRTDKGEEEDEDEEHEPKENGEERDKTGV